MTDRRGFLAGALALVVGVRGKGVRGNGSHLGLDRASERQTVVDFDPKWANGSHPAMGSKVQWLTKDEAFLKGMPTVGRVIGIRLRYRTTSLCETHYYVDFGKLQLWVNGESLRVIPSEEGTSVGFYGKFPQVIR